MDVCCTSYEATQYEASKPYPLGSAASIKSGLAGN